MKCEICRKKIEETFLGKPVGAYFKDKKGKKHTVCNKCQQKFTTKDELIAQLK